MKYIVRIACVCGWCAAVLAMFVSAVLVVPAWFGIRPYVVRSGSMEPVLPTGALVLVDTGRRDFAIGDIITYRLSGHDEGEILVTHRIVGRSEDGFLTKGDANEAEDQRPVRPAQIVGGVLAQIPWMGYLAARMTPGLCMTAVCWILFLNGLSLAAANVKPMD